MPAAVLQSCKSRRAFVQMTGGALIGAGMLYQAGEFAAHADEALERISRTREPLKNFILKYAAAKDVPWLAMHGVRAMGRDFTIDGEAAVPFLCRRYLQEKSVNGHSYLYMPVADEGHANVFLAEALLDSGFGLDYAFSANDRQYNVADLVASARALFVFEPTSMTFNPDDLAWSLLAFAYTTPPGSDEWTTADGKRIRFADVVEYAMATCEQANARFAANMREGVLADAPDAIDNFSCAGTHLVYGLSACVRFGYSEQSLTKRMQEQFDILIWRLAAETRIAKRYYSQLDDQYPKAIVRMYLLDALLKFSGHAFETLMSARVHGQLTTTPAQEELMKGALSELLDTIDELVAMRLEDMELDESLRKLLIGDACHAYHALSMMNDAGKAGQTL